MADLGVEALGQLQGGLLGGRRDVRGGALLVAGLVLLMAHIIIDAGQAGQVYPVRTDHLIQTHQPLHPRAPALQAIHIRLPAVRPGHRVQSGLSKVEAGAPYRQEDSSC